MLQPFSDHLHTIITDNGKEFAEHENLTNQPKAAYFIADPYIDWERGTIENMNGLIHQYFPKAKDYTAVTDMDLMWIMNRLNPTRENALIFSHLLRYSMSSLLHLRVESNVEIIRFRLI